MSVKKFTLGLAVAIAATCVTSSAFADVLAGWYQNDNADAAAGDGFGYRPSDFPQLADVGAVVTATHSIANFDPNMSGLVYRNVDSFAGSGTLGEVILSGDAAPGGSFSFIGTSNNGASEIYSVSTLGYNDILVSWTQRGTGTGFTSRVFEYSSNGGLGWTSIGAYNHVDATIASAGVLGATFKLVQLDLSAIAAIENNPLTQLRITYSGATGATGNNRLDNFFVQGTVIPEPSTVALLFAGLMGCATTRRRTL